MDNETSKEVEDFIRAQQTDLQYSLPLRHYRPTEKAVQTYKACFKSTTALLPSEFPISLWCRLTDQVDFAVNTVRPCRQNPRLSAWAACNGDFHFDSTPIAPPGTAMLMHIKPENRSSFGFNAKRHSTLDHILNITELSKVSFPQPEANAFQILSNSKHHAIAIPELTPADRILEAARQLHIAIKQQPKETPMDEITAVEILRKFLTGN